MERWYNRYLQVYGKNYDETAYADINAQVRQNMKKLQSDCSVVTVSVISYNEEKHLLVYPPTYVDAMVDVMEKDSRVVGGE